MTPRVLDDVSDIAALRGIQQVQARQTAAVQRVRQSSECGGCGGWCGPFAPAARARKGLRRVSRSQPRALRPCSRPTRRRRPVWPPPPSARETSLDIQTRHCKRARAAAPRGPTPRRARRSWPPRAAPFGTARRAAGGSRPSGLRCRRQLHRPRRRLRQRPPRQLGGQVEGNKSSVPLLLLALDSHLGGRAIGK